MRLRIRQDPHRCPRPEKGDIQAFRPSIMVGVWEDTLATQVSGPRSLETFLTRNKNFRESIFFYDLGLGYR